MCFSWRWGAAVVYGVVEASSDASCKTSTSSWSASPSALALGAAFGFQRLVDYSALNAFPCVPGSSDFGIPFRDSKGNWSLSYLNIGWPSSTSSSGPKLFLRASAGVGLGHRAVREVTNWRCGGLPGRVLPIVSDWLLVRMLYHIMDQLPQLRSLVKTKLALDGVILYLHVSARPLALASAADGASVSPPSASSSKMRLLIWPF